MQKLHLLGISDDGEELLLVARRGAKNPRFRLVLDDELIEAVLDLTEEVDDEVEEPTPTPTPTPASDRRSIVLPTRHGLDGEPDQPSRLSVKELQDRLRAGWTVDDLASTAGVPVEKVERFAHPIWAEQRRVVDRARALVYEKRRVGESGRNLGESVAWNVAEKGVRLTPAELEAAWSARITAEGEWVVAFSYVSRGRQQVAEWAFGDDGQLVNANRLGAQLGYVEPGRRRPAAIAADSDRPPPPSPKAKKATKSKPKRKAKKKAAAKKRPAKKKAAAKKRPAKKKAAAKKRPAKKKAAAKKRPASKKAAAKKRPASKKAAAKKRPAKKKAAAKKRPAKKKAAAKKRPAKKKAAAKKRPASKKAAAKKRPASKKAAARKAPAKRAPAKPQVSGRPDARPDAEADPQLPAAADVGESSSPSSVEADDDRHTDDGGDFQAVLGGDRTDDWDDEPTQPVFREGMAKRAGRNRDRSQGRRERPLRAR